MIINEIILPKNIPATKKPLKWNFTLLEFKINSFTLSYFIHKSRQTTIQVIASQIYGYGAFFSQKSVRYYQLFYFADKNMA